MPDLTIKNEDSHPTPSTGYTRFYIKEDKKPYIKDDTGTETALEAGEAAEPVGYIHGFLMTYLNASSITLGQGKCRSQNDNFDIVNVAPRTANLTLSGAGGLDTGAEASNTWYAVHIIDDSSGTNTEAAMFSLSATSPTLPAGYDRSRRVGWVRNDGSSNILKFFQDGEGENRRIVYDEEFSSLEVLNSGSATSYTSVDLSDHVPSTSLRPIMSIELEHDAKDSLAYFRPTGSTVSDGGFWFGAGTDKGNPGYGQIELRSDSSQSIDYQVEDNGDDLFLYVVGYYDQLSVY